MSKIILGYWYFRGLGEPIRYLLHYKNVKFVDKRYQFDGTWQKEKFSLGLDFPNLPYYFEDNLKLTQSLTILRYLAKKHNLEGKTEEEQLRASLVEQQITDFATVFFRDVVYAKSNDSPKEFLKNAPGLLKPFSEFLGERNFFAGDEITYVDFLVYDNFDFPSLFSKTILDAFPNLKAFQDRIRNLPELQEYLNSSAYIKWPICGPPDACTWGGSGEMPN
nr:glutathione S-transferase Mu 1-like [Parasteatoda tepidariorum]